MINLKLRIIMLFDKFSGLNTDYEGLQPGVGLMVGNPEARQLAEVGVWCWVFRSRWLLGGMRYPDIAEGVCMPCRSL